MTFLTVSLSIKFSLYLLLLFFIIYYESMKMDYLVLELLSGNLSAAPTSSISVAVTKLATHSTLD